MQLKTALNLIYPAQCMTCDAVVEETGALCGICWRETRFITGLTCLQCGTPLLGDAGEADTRCDDCLQIARPWRRGFAAILYDGNGRRLVLSLKHGDRTEHARPASKWMARRIETPDPDTLVVPVPLHWLRFLKRRYNQSALLAKYLAEELSLEYAPYALHRPRATPKLDGKTKNDRFETLNMAIVAHPKHGTQLAGRPVLLVDDVMTSGATLAACTEACHLAGADSVNVIVLARVAKDN